MAIINNIYSNSVLIKYKEGDFSIRRLIAFYEPSAEGDIHLVKDGDELTAIAYRYYGDPTQWFHIADANKIFNPFELTTGSSLTISDIDDLIYNRGSI